METLTDDMATMKINQTYAPVKFTTYDLNDENIEKYNLNERSTYNVGIFRLDPTSNKKIFNSGISYRDWLKQESLTDDQKYDDIDDVKTEHAPQNSKEYNKRKYDLILIESVQFYNNNT